MESVRYPASTNGQPTLGALVVRGKRDPAELQEKAEEYREALALAAAEGSPDELNLRPAFRNGELVPLSRSSRAFVRRPSPVVYSRLPAHHRAMGDSACARCSTIYHRPRRWISPAVRGFVLRHGDEESQPTRSARPEKEPSAAASAFKMCFILSAR